VETVDTADLEARRARFDIIVRGLVEPLRRFLARRTDAATADDVIGDTLLVLWRRYDDLPDEPLPFAYGVARPPPCNRPNPNGSRTSWRQP
jgi:RNA polymerase sigma-70 factor (ECF subfamily)